MNGPSKDLASSPGEAKAPSAPKRRILLVEDHTPTLAITALLLERAGFVVSTADSMAEAIVQAGASPIDVLVSDLGLPDGNGADLLRTLRSQGHQFPAVAVSGYGEAGDVSATEAAGFQLHLIKPVDLPDLQAAIEKVLGA